MAPPHIFGVATDRGPEDEPETLALKLAPPPRTRGTRGLKHLDATAFGNALTVALKDSVGHVFALQKSGQIIFPWGKDWAQTPADCSLPWTLNRKMHIASVSKLITAMAMSKALMDKNMSYDDQIINYLPSYWHKGQNINKITFRHLLTHTSGFHTAHGESDFQVMKLFVAIGVSNSPQAPFRLGHYDYENLNFGLCRILLPIIAGIVNKNALLSDSAWDLVTIVGYAQYVQEKIFTPSGVSGASLGPSSNGVLAYYFPAGDTDGWDSGYKGAISGGAGWHMSVNSLLKVMKTFRRGKLTTPSRASSMLYNEIGIDVRRVVPSGFLFEKNGRYRDSQQSVARVEQCIAYFLPEGMELVVFMNSYLGMFQPRSLRDVVTQVYLDNLK